MVTLFVNRSQELARLCQLLEDASEAAALIVIRSPAGFGKSRLTDQLVASSGAAHSSFCIVDPDVRGSVGTARLHEGFFIQRCAESLSDAAGKGVGHWRPFTTFLKERRWKTAAEKKLLDALRELPSPKSAYATAYDYISRLAGFGNFSAEGLFASDDAAAVRLCEDYVTEALERYRPTLILREVQHCDLRSLRMLLGLNAQHRGTALVIEYTAEEAEFAPDHAKVFRNAADKRNFHILQLLKLEPEHLEALIRGVVEPDFSMPAEAYLKWNGNVGSVLEMKFRVGIVRKVSDDRDISLPLADIEGAIAERIRGLNDLEQLLTVVTLVNVEAIDLYGLSAVTSAIRPTTTAREIERALAALRDNHGVIRSTYGTWGITNETVANVLRTIPQLKPLIAVSEDALRNHYVNLIRHADYGSVGLALALRQVFRLCAATRDIVALKTATEALTREVGAAQDQSVYVAAVEEAVGPDAAEDSDREEIVVWAAAVAFGAGHWGSCAALLARSRATHPFTWSMQAFALQEIGRHDEALALGIRLSQDAKSLEEALIGQLIRTLVLGCQGASSEARAILDAMLASDASADHPLLGYAHRFFEVIADYAEAREHLRRSSEIFERAGLSRSRAYSDLACAVLDARFGDLDLASQRVAAAAEKLVDDVHDRHVVLNNRAAVDLLRDAPDYERCCADLTQALKSSRDDYCDLTILSNLAIAYEGRGDRGRALEALRQAFNILHDHDFADVDVYWPVCFNAAAIFRHAGRQKEAKDAERFPKAHGRPVSVNKAYWGYRFDNAPAVEELAFLCARRRHPLYISHWLVELEGLELLRQPLPQ